MADKAKTMNRDLHAWAEGRPVFLRLPEAGYQDNPVADYLTAAVDQDLAEVKTTMEQWYRQLSPDTCDDSSLDYLGYLVGFSGDYWNLSWPSEVKRELIRQSHGFLWPYKGTLKVIRKVLDIHGIPHDVWSNDGLRLTAKLGQGNRFGATEPLRFFIRMPKSVNRRGEQWKEAETTLRAYSPAIAKAKACYRKFWLGMSAVGDPMFSPDPLPPNRKLIAWDNFGVDGLLSGSSLTMGPAGASWSVVGGWAKSAGSVNFTTANTLQLPAISLADYSAVWELDSTGATGFALLTGRNLSGLPYFRLDIPRGSGTVTYRLYYGSEFITYVSQPYTGPIGLFKAEIQCQGPYHRLLVNDNEVFCTHVPECRHAGTIAAVRQGLTALDFKLYELYEMRRTGQALPAATMGELIFWEQFTQLPTTSTPAVRWDSQGYTGVNLAWPVASSAMTMSGTAQEFNITGLPTEEYEATIQLSPAPDTLVLLRRSTQASSDARVRFYSNGNVGVRVGNSGGAWTVVGSTPQGSPCTLVVRLQGQRLTLTLNGTQIYDIDNPNLPLVTARSLGFWGPGTVLSDVKIRRLL